MLCISSLLTAILLAHIAVAQVHLAVSPNCGSFSGSPADVNVGLPPLHTFDTIISFGDAYTDGGSHDGGALPPAVLTPPNPKAGGRTSNGPVWVEYLANDANATLHDYAAAGSVVDAADWSGVNGQIDFVTQANLAATNERLHSTDPSTTLAVVFYGISDYEQALAHNETVANSELPGIAEDLLYILDGLTEFTRNFLIVDNYGRGTQTALGDAWKQQLFSYLGSIRQTVGLNVAFVDLKTLWDGVLGSNPGFAAFGYSSAGACTVNDVTTVGACSDPDTTFYWIPGYPSTVTHRIVADYVEAAVSQCVSNA